MDKSTLITFLIANGKWFVQFFCVLFGVIAQECYQVLKDDNYKFKKVLYKLVLAWFVCLILGSFITDSQALKKFYPIIIMALAFLHRQGADWIAKDFFPILKEILLRALSNKTKPKDE